MKRRNRGKLPTAAKISGAFARGVIATALVGALQDRSDVETPPRPARKILRHAVQGGAALASATLVAKALRRRNYGLALAAVTAGALGIVAVEYLLFPNPLDKDKENGLGQKEA